jgi:hypothetical protein
MEFTGLAGRSDKTFSFQRKLDEQNAGFLHIAGFLIGNPFGAADVQPIQARLINGIGMDSLSKLKVA